MFKVGDKVQIQCSESFTIHYPKICVVKEVTRYNIILSSLDGCIERWECPIRYGKYMSCKFSCGEVVKKIEKINLNKILKYGNR